MIRRYLLALCALALAPLGAVSAGSISFVPLTTTTVAPGGSVTFQIYGSSVNAITLFSLYLTSSGTGNQFQLTSYSLNTALFDDSSFTLPMSLPSDPVVDLGSFVTGADLAANTSYLLSTATVTINGSTPGGSFTIGNTTDSGFSNPDFSFFDSAPDSNLAINVAAVPEPSTWGIVLGGGLTCLALARRFRTRVRA